jgi:hypothetical protein
MYKNQIIVLIKKDGQPLRETEGKYVFLPFNSEYSIELKNQSWRRAVASIKIDGTDVLGGDEIIIPAYGAVNVERFITNGDLNKGRKLKFVPLTDSKVQDPSSPENGLVEIECWFEKQPEIKLNYHPFWYDSSSIYGTGGWAATNVVGQTSHASYRTRSAGTVKKSFTPDSAAPQATVYCCSMGMMENQSISAQNMSTGQAGATVEGGGSNQSFSHGYFGQKEHPSVAFRFWLRGVQQEVTTEDKLYCTNCGKKTRFDYKFCPRCGQPVQIA